jgi:hypothetical protein
MTPKEMSKEGFIFPKTDRLLLHTHPIPPHRRLEVRSLARRPPTKYYRLHHGRRTRAYERMTLGFARAGADRITICSRSTSELDEVAAKIRTVNGDIKVSIVKCDVTSEE